MPGITDIPVEVFLDNLLQCMTVTDIGHLAVTSKFFNTLCSDETFWKVRLQADFNFSGADTARKSGWKFIYQRLHKPRVFVWGPRDHGRLGLTTFPKSTIPDVPFPTELKIPGARIVSLAAAGMSFQALDSEGSVYVWGQLDGTGYSLSMDGFSNSAKGSPTPLKLRLPNPTRAISCGRLHFSTLDSANQIWTFLNWGRPFRLSSPLLRAPHFIPVQVECGWTFSAAVSKSGDVLVWWPFSDPLETRISDKYTELDVQENTKAQAVDGIIPCVLVDIKADPVTLPPIPRLPVLSEDVEEQSEPRIIQIGGLDNSIVALTNQGHVLKFGPIDNNSSVSRAAWQYLPAFSELNQVQSHPVFDQTQPDSIQAPSSLKITHISGHFQSFTAYSSGPDSVVLMGDMMTTANSVPNIIPALQNRSVISVVLGDYHKGALLSTGKLLTWGGYSKGALGLGDPALLEAGAPGGFPTEELRLRAQERRRGTPPDVQIPAEVRFDHACKKPKDRFCISATASGWHMGALVIDLEADDDDDKEGIEEEAVQDLPPPPFQEQGPGQSPPILPWIMGGGPTRGGHRGRGALGGFRIGFAGRGMGRGNAGNSG
ncbi:regulator of chromosome condensation 1/beta-lactamase-inhibitor protein II [Mycena floridula]|nr:regulator of chromosome condensation 1/beta-lactamase-inhibitor protein II [Mycena floridula]